MPPEEFFATLADLMVFSPPFFLSFRDKDPHELPVYTIIIATISGYGCVRTRLHSLSWRPPERSPCLLWNVLDYKFLVKGIE